MVCPAVPQISTYNSDPVSMSHLLIKRLLYNPTCVLQPSRNALQAYIRVGGKHVHLGCHDGEVAAAQAFDQAAMLRHAHQLGPQTGAAGPALVTNFTPAFYQV